VSNGLPEPILIGPLRMKPAGAFDQPIDGCDGWLELSSCLAAVSQKVEPHLEAELHP